MDDLFTQSTSATKAVKFIRKMQGRSQAVLVRCDNGQHYVVKMVGCPQGPNVLANEWLGSILACSVHLPASKSQFVYFSPSFIASNPDLTFDLPEGNVVTVPGLHVGSLFAGEVTGGRRLLQFLPKTKMADVVDRHSFVGMYLFDVWAGQRAPRKVVFRRTGATSSLKPVFISHSQLFGGPNWNFPEWKPRERQWHISLYSDLCSTQAVNAWVETLRKEIPEVLLSATALVPEEWYVGDLGGVRAFLLERLESLPELFDRQIVLDGLQTTGIQTDE